MSIIACRCGQGGLRRRARATACETDLTSGVRLHGCMRTTPATPGRQAAGAVRLGPPAGIIIRFQAQQRAAGAVCFPPPTSRACLLPMAPLQVDCGYVGINQQICQSKGCCWNPSGTSGVPWCYYGAGTSNTCYAPQAGLSTPFNATEVATMRSFFLANINIQGKGGIVAAPDYNTPGGASCRPAMPVPLAPPPLRPATGARAYHHLPCRTPIITSLPACVRAAACRLLLLPLDAGRRADDAVPAGDRGLVVRHRVHC